MAAMGIPTTPCRLRHRRAWGTGLLVGLASLAACAAPPTSAPGAGRAGNACPDAVALQAAALQAINAARAKARRCGGQPAAAAGRLGWSPALAQAAAAHADAMARHGFFDHAGQDGSNAGDRARAAGYQWQTVGENIALGQPGVAEAMQGWLGSPGHCINLMNPAFRDAGLACRPNAEGRPLWVLNLGAPLARR